MSAGQGPDEKFRLQVTSDSHWFPQYIFDEVVTARQHELDVYGAENKVVWVQTHPATGVQTHVNKSSSAQEWIDKMSDPKNRRMEAVGRVLHMFDRGETGCGKPLIGYTLSGRNLDSSRKTATYLGCALLCAAEEGCKAWTWTKDTHYCWLKGRVLSSAYPSKHAVSAYCLQMSPTEQILLPESSCGAAIHDSHIIGTVVTKVASCKDWLKCREACADDKRCDGWTLRNQTCWLKRNISTEVSTESGSVSGACKHMSPFLQRMPPTAQCNSPQRGKDNRGNILNAGEWSEDWQQCRRMCQTLPGWCKGWTWMQDTQRCWLLSELLESPVSDKRAISGGCKFKQQTPILDCSVPAFAQDLVGGVSHRDKIYSKNWEECRLMCQAKPGCKGWTWKIDSHECWLKNWAHERTSNRISVIGYCHQKWT